MLTYEEKRTILVVEDNLLNREILKSILEDSYQVVEAENGQEGLDFLDRADSQVSLILLDIQMPVMNGYEFLAAMQERPQFSGIPIIVTTSSDTLEDELQCLESGASDFVTKPYNPEIVLKRAASMIRLSEASAMLRRVEYDTLTGLYSSEFFYENATRIRERNPDMEFDIVCTDIDSFKIINERYGEARGDQLLRYWAEKLREEMEGSSICGRLGGDVFAVFCPHYSYAEHQLREQRLLEALAEGPVPSASVYFGVSCNIPRELPISMACDNARLALEGIKGQYGTHLAIYDEVVRQKMLRRQQLIDRMEDALKNREFHIYFQAKHDLQRDRTGGAEALVRWISPELGFISPGDFIPLFEQNGFITQLDFYMVEAVCRLQRKWLDEGAPVVPVSVNISRLDFEQPDLVPRLEETVDRYQVPRELIHLEVTESAYIDDPTRIVPGVRQMKQAGFCVELDDFGSGFSSLGTLSKLTPDVLKLDMSIVRNLADANEQVVVRCILSMAKQLHMKAVAEGTETEDQVNTLREMGCDYAQGYYYSKPLPQEEFAQYLQNTLQTK